ncbi:proteinase-activated receptor 3 [Salvelinus sp. IW2-2015]|uniref:proteinase-activated receptor 3 n=1 Tax=Salvelinus sp. IW2-2015 TaxID=2691554 RepID=UPI000CDFB4D5|nr:proteinase-activated receptor 3 [Salvelinus alpinus]
MWRRQEKDRTNTLAGILFCLTVGLSLQDNEEKVNKTKITTLAVLDPRTFNGRRVQTNCTAAAGPPSLVNLSPGAPGLDVRLEDPAVAYTTGLLSTRLIPSAYLLAMAVGIPSNAYILTFLRLRARSFSTAVLYLSLALSDLLLLLSLALRVHYHLNGNNWVFGEAACRVVTACFYGNVYCSAHTIACVSLKRYLAVVRPFLYRRLHKTAWALGASLGVWGLFGVAVVPELLVRQSFLLPRLGFTTCHDILPLEDSPHALLVPYRLALVCLGLLVPFVVCAWTHVAVVRHLGRSGLDWTPFIRVSTLVFLIFTVCFAPSGVLHIAHYVRLSTSGGDGLYVYSSAAVCLCCFHSCLDPFLCILMSRTTASKLRFASLRRTQQTPVLV